MFEAFWFGVAMTGCTSLFYRVFNIHATQGVYGVAGSWWRLFAAVAVDACVAVCLPLGLGVVASLACRLATQQRQSCGERLLRLQPMREVVGPTHFSHYAPGRAGGAGGSSRGGGNDGGDDGGIATDDDDE